MTHRHSRCTFLVLMMIVFCPVDPNTCSSTSSERWAKYFNKTVLTMQPGSPCNDFKGYCDVLKRCRVVDADGPLLRLKKTIFNPELYENISDWLAAYWWAILLIVIGYLVLMMGFICLCSPFIKSHNNTYSDKKPLPVNLRKKQDSSSRVRYTAANPRNNRST